MRQVRLVSWAAALALAGTGLATPAFAAEAGTAGTAAAENYAALGDSYSSGVGTREYFDDSGSCLRSPRAYPQLWADAHAPASFEFVACSGATTADVNSNQLDALDTDTSFVTISVGGNDIGFADTIQDCLLGTDDMCLDSVAEGEALMREELPGALASTYDGISAAAPNASVLVLGYPRLNELGDCGIPGYTEVKRKRLNEASDLLSGVIADAASAAGFTYADVRSAFDGHGVCAGTEWINGPSNPVQESFHPNVDGQAHGYLPALG
ncbi:lipase [Allosaccharopolyspora coralli]|uniref:Lipase n=1 Tax=Allosaccharopolyspora coralli TaxID=2665642 RepID=A0A5Q3QBG5_9PSEU|nr:SGNH/GDSL hydrolase family protein [Allosaccharopolyspora coralli]QGK70564.1 lipase [Allosaccharopolyspora coralli]